MSDLVSRFKAAATINLSPPADRSAPASRRARLVYGIDATASREPTWAIARTLTAAMFDSTAAIGGLDVQLIHYKGHQPPIAGPFVSDARRLTDAMAAVRCVGGATQIGALLERVRREHVRQAVAALVFIGDVVEEDSRTLAETASRLGVRCFVFHENPDENYQSVAAFKLIAAKSGGVYLPFDRDSAGKLAGLLAGIAAFAAGGVKALEDRGDASSQLLLGHMRKGA